MPSFLPSASSLSSPDATTSPDGPAGAATDPPALPRTRSPPMAGASSISCSWSTIRLPWRRWTRSWRPRTRCWRLLSRLRRISDSTFTSRSFRRPSGAENSAMSRGARRAVQAIARDDSRTRRAPASRPARRSCASTVVPSTSRKTPARSSARWPGSGPGGAPIRSRSRPLGGRSSRRGIRPIQTTRVSFATTPSSGSSSSRTKTTARSRRTPTSSTRVRRPSLIRTERRAPIDVPNSGGSVQAGRLRTLFPRGAIRSGGRLTPIAELRQFLAELKPSPDNVMLALIAGPDHPVVLGPGASPEMASPVIEPSCTGASGEPALPALRLKSFADTFGPNGLFLPACAPATSFPNALTTMLTTLNIKEPRCLSGTPTATDAGIPSCLVTATHVDENHVETRWRLSYCDADRSVLPCWQLGEVSSCSAGAPRLQICRDAACSGSSPLPESGHIDVSCEVACR